MTYYVYGTFIERNRYKFETKEDALKFEKFARKNMKTSFDWVFYDKDENLENIETTDGLSMGLWDNYQEHRRVAKETCFISKPIKSTSIWNRLQHYFFIIFKRNNIKGWENPNTNYIDKNLNMNIWSDYIPYRPDYSYEVD